MHSTTGERRRPPGPAAPGAMGRQFGREAVKCLSRGPETRRGALCTGVRRNSREQGFPRFDLKKLFQYEELCLSASPPTLRERRLFGKVLVIRQSFSSRVTHAEGGVCKLLKHHHWESILSFP